MIKNSIYKEAIERAVSKVVIRDGSVLVTGASGLIGSCLIDLLLYSNRKGRQFKVYALGRSEEKLKKRFSDHINVDTLHIIEQDVRKPLLNDFAFDYIFHGASNADPRSYALYPVETMLVNIEGGASVLNYCKDHPTTRALMMSTFEVYGNMGKDVYKETDFGAIDQNRIRSCYPESKRSMELLTRCYVEEYGVNAVIGRLCSIYGPTMTKDDSKAHAQFIRNGLRGENIVLKSKGEQRRTYCYVLDAVTGVLFAMANGKAGEAYNISNEKSVASIAEVAQKVATIVGTDVVYEVPDEKEKQGYSVPLNCILDNSKLKGLGWESDYTLSEGITECIEILRQQQKAYLL